MSLYFTAVNRNKRSITLDLKKPAGMTVLYDLVKRSDVLVENFIPGKVEAMGFGYEELRNLNERIVYASISGHGASGPNAKRAGYDAVAAADGGQMHIIGEADGKPLHPGLGMVDMSTGMLMHGTLAALRAWESTGKGQRLGASLFETQLSLLINIGANWLNMDARFIANPLRVHNRDALDAVLTSILLEKTDDEWLSIFDQSGLAHGPVNTIEKAFEHPQAESKSMIVQRSSKHTETGSLNMIGPVVKFSANGANIRSAALLLGEHTEEVLSEFGVFCRCCRENED